MRGIGRAIAPAFFTALMSMTGVVEAATVLKPQEPKLEPLPKEKFAELRAALGACIVSKNQSVVKKYLAHSDSLTVDYNAMDVDPKMAMFMFKMDACMKYNVPQMMQPIFMAPGALRNLLLESAYLDRVKGKPAAILGENGQPAPAPARNFASKDDKLATAKAYASIADCTAANGLDMADALLRTNAGLPDERQAAVALAPVIGACLPEGANIALNPATIRSLAAEGLWQRYASGNPAQSSAK